MKALTMLGLFGFAILAGCSHESRPVATAVGVKRTIDRPAVENDMKQLAIFYKLLEAEQGRVKSAAVFKSYIKRDAAKLYKALEDNVYVVVPNVRGGSNGVIAYEAKADAAGQHIVALGDGSVQTLSTQQLQAALKGQ
jgi:hypothetical protein